MTMNIIAGMTMMSTTSLTGLGASEIDLISPKTSMKSVTDHRAFLAKGTDIIATAAEALTITTKCHARRIDIIHKRSTVLPGVLS